MNAFLILGIVFLFSSGTAPASGSAGEPGNDLPELAAGQLVKAGDNPIEVDIGHLVPCLVDWNNDGLKDLVVGQFKGGKIRLYLNRGTAGNPLFGEFEYLKAGGKEISLPAG
jgi:hypothetical protein